VVWFDVRSVCGRSEGVPMFLGRWIFVRVFVPEPFFFFCVCVCVCVCKCASLWCVRNATRTLLALLVIQKIIEAF